METNKKLHVGQRIELFEVLTDGGFKSGVFTPGTVRPANKAVFDDDYTVNVLDNDGDFTTMCIVPFQYYKKEVRSVGAMIITKLK